MPEVDAQTGNLFDNQGLDVLQSCRDRLSVERGSRADTPNYGFPFGSWTTLSTAELTAAINLALEPDELVNDIQYDYSDTGHLRVTVNSNISLTF